MSEKIYDEKMKAWQLYYDGLEELQQKGLIDLQLIPTHCTHNAHMFYIKVKNLKERTKLIDFLKQNDIITVFYYIPLHRSPGGLKFGRFYGDDTYTTKESERLIRLPLYIL